MDPTILGRFRYNYTTLRRIGVGVDKRLIALDHPIVPVQISNDGSCTSLQVRCNIYNYGLDVGNRWGRWAETPNVPFKHVESKSAQCTQREYVALNGSIMGIKGRELGIAMLQGLLFRFAIKADDMLFKKHKLLKVWKANRRLHYIFEIVAIDLFGHPLRIEAENN